MYDDKMTPLQLAYNALNLVTFAMYIQFGLRSGELPQDIFNRPVRITQNTKDGGVRIEQKWKPEDIMGISTNLANCALGTSVIALNSALEQAFRGRPEKESSESLRAARVIVYNLRCAFAHTPHEPIWEINNPIYRDTWTIKTPIFYMQLDFNILNSKEFVIDQIGGWQGFFALFHYCIEQIQNRTGESGKKIRINIDPSSQNLMM